MWLLWDEREKQKEHVLKESECKNGFKSATSRRTTNYPNNKKTNEKRHTSNDTEMFNKTINAKRAAHTQNWIEKKKRTKAKRKRNFQITTIVLYTCNNNCLFHEISRIRPANFPNPRFFPSMFFICLFLRWKIIWIKIELLSSHCAQIQITWRWWNQL